MVTNLTQECSLFPTCEDNTHGRDIGINSLSAAEERVNNAVPNSTLRNVSQSSQGRAAAACLLSVIYHSREAIASDGKGRPRATQHDRFVLPFMMILYNLKLKLSRMISEALSPLW